MRLAKRLAGRLLEGRRPLCPLQGHFHLYWTCRGRMALFGLYSSSVKSCSCLATDMIYESTKIASGRLHGLFKCIVLVFVEIVAAHCEIEWKSKCGQLEWQDKHTRQPCLSNEHLCTLTSCQAHVMTSSISRLLMNHNFTSLHSHAEHDTFHDSWT